MEELNILCLEGGWCFRNRLGRRLAQHFGGFFHKIKKLQQIGREDSIQAVCRSMRRLVGFLYEAAKNFELFLQFQNQN
jgi:hypothetical protein